jgi:hypothetical protein
MMEIPAVGPVVALTTFASIGDPGRFRGDSRLAAAYTGLVPSATSASSTTTTGIGGDVTSKRFGLDLA